MSDFPARRATYPTTPQPSSPVTISTITNRVENPTLKVQAPDQLLAALGNTWQTLIKVIDSLERLGDKLRGTGASQPQQIMPAGVIGVARTNKDLATQALELIGTIEQLIGDDSSLVDEMLCAEVGVDLDAVMNVDHSTHDCSLHAATMEPNLTVRVPELRWGDVLTSYGHLMVTGDPVRSRDIGVTEVGSWFYLVPTNGKHLRFEDDHWITVKIYRANDPDAGNLDMDEVRTATVATGSIDATDLMDSFLDNGRSPLGIDYGVEREVFDDADRLEHGIVRTKPANIGQGWSVQLADEWVSVAGVVIVGPNAHIIDADGVQHTVPASDYLDTKASRAPLTDEEIEFGITESAPETFLDPS